MSRSYNSASDIRKDAWVLRIAPKAARPYLRLIRADRPIGTWLLLLPCLWSLALASKYAGIVTPSISLIALFAIGSFVMRGAGCVINDLWDRDIDGKIARTAERPIASGEVSVRQALIFLALLLLAGLMVLIQFNATAITLGFASVGLVVAYPLMKRFTYWPQAFLGITFNWGALLAWAAVTGSVDAPAIALYIAGVFWTLGYDTVYGHQDKEDDIVVGVKSSSIKLGRNTGPFVAAVYTFVVIFLLIAGNLTNLDWFYYLMVGVVAVQFVWQIATLNIDDPANCLARFKSNRDVGLVIFLGILMG